MAIIQIQKVVSLQDDIPDGQTISKIHLMSCNLDQSGDLLIRVEATLKEE